MKDVEFTAEERRLLLGLARQAITQAVTQGSFSLPDLEQLPPRLREKGVCFVTLTMPNGDLRGCIGALEATHPLAFDVCEHAAAAAREDYRFYPVRPDELPLLHIEISCLTCPVPLDYECPEDLPKLLRPNLDGVILREGRHRATFLPQVWEKLADPDAFLSQLCLKMGAPADLWRRKKIQIETYQVEEFHEEA